MRRTLLLILTIAFLSSGCSDANKARWRRLLHLEGEEKPAVGTFVLLQGQQVNKGGKAVPAVIRMDSRTGETWVLNVGEQSEWVGVRDNLKPVLKWNPSTDKLESGHRLPDGRDIRDLSRDELLRLLATLGESKNPKTNDPLAIR